MHAEYLRSIRSPHFPGKFKVPVPKQPHKREFSNLSNLEEEESYAEVKILFIDDVVILNLVTYFQDSFCVTNESSGEVTEDSLEILEKQLEMKERERKSSKTLKENLPESSNAKKKQMRRVLAPVSSSDRYV